MRLVPLLLLICTSAFSQEEFDSLNYYDSVAFYADTTLYEGEDEYNYTEETNYSEEETTADPHSLQSTESYQAEQISVKKFDKDKWKAIVGNQDFEEEKEEEDQPAENFDLPAFNVPWANPVLQAIAYGIIIAAVVVVLYLLLRNFSWGSRITKHQIKTADLTHVEDIDELNIDHLLEQAIKQSNLRLAVRLYYLRLLKSLHNQGIILWKKDKTNSEYLTEIFVKNYHFHDIQKLTLAYEQVWYGEHGVTPEVFQYLTGSFQKLQQKLQTADSR